MTDRAPRSRVRPGRTASARSHRLRTPGSSAATAATWTGPAVSRIGSSAQSSQRALDRGDGVLGVRHGKDQESELIPAIQVDIDDRIAPPGADQQATPGIEDVLLGGKSPGLSDRGATDVIDRDAQFPRLFAAGEQQRVAVGDGHLQVAAAHLDIDHWHLTATTSG